jgi:F-type H+-transporting ATPase subunit a
VLSLFAATDIHVSLKAEPLFYVGPVPITNSMVYGLLCAIAMAILTIAVARRVTVKPKKKHYLTNLVEMMVGYVMKLLEGPFGTPEKAAKFASIFGVFFIFILLNNLFGLLPIVGPSVHSGETPLFRPFTADLNGTIAMSVIAIIIVQILSIREQGVKKHLQHYFSNKPHDPINFFIGILEVFGEFTRILSLSLRLFLNTAVGEILIAVFTSMVLSAGRTPLAVIPIIIFEILVAYIQAYVFTVLTGTYLGMAIAHADEHHDDHSPTDTPLKVEPGAHGV